ncbi:polyketide synthase dehydratase domain-containing protein, partial [Nonomuraea sp. NPDC001699]
MVEVPEQGGLVLTGRLSLAAHSWLADHAVGGSVIFPGTGFVELVIRAGDGVGCSRVEELTLEAPLVLDTDSSAQVLVRVSGAGADGRREVHVYARPAGAGAGTGTGAGAGLGEGWRRHASAVIAESEMNAASATNIESADSVGVGAGVDGSGGAAVDFALDVWPPVGARAVEVEGFYQKLADEGYGYGPAFRGLKRAWVREGEVFAEVELGERECVDAARFGVHPALLDAALHATSLPAHIDQTNGADNPGGAGVMLPFAWTGVELLASGARQLRVHVQPASDAGGGVSIRMADGSGAPVAVVTSLVSRPLPADGLASGGLRAGERPVVEGLHQLQWLPIPGNPADAASKAASDATPGQVIVVGPSSGDVVAAVQEAGGTVVGHYRDLPALNTALAAGESTAETVILSLDMRAPTHDTNDEHGELLSRLRVELDRVVEVLRGWLASERLAETRLV